MIPQNTHGFLIFATNKNTYTADAKSNAALDASFFPNLLVILPENGAKINVHAVPNKLAIDIAFVFLK